MDDGGWACPGCTFVNASTADSCEICGGPPGTGSALSAGLPAGADSTFLQHISKLEKVTEVHRVHDHAYYNQVNDAMEAVMALKEFPQAQQWLANQNHTRSPLAYIFGGDVTAPADVADVHNAAVNAMRYVAWAVQQFALQLEKETDAAAAAPAPPSAGGADGAAAPEPAPMTAVNTALFLVSMVLKPDNNLFRQQVKETEPLYRGAGLGMLGSVGGGVTRLRTIERPHLYEELSRIALTQIAPALLHLLELSLHSESIVCDDSPFGRFPSGYTFQPRYGYQGVMFIKSVLAALETLVRCARALPAVAAEAGLDEVRLSLAAVSYASAVATLPEDTWKRDQNAGDALRTVGDALLTLYGDASPFPHQWRCAAIRAGLCSGLQRQIWACEELERYILQIKPGSAAGVPTIQQLAAWLVGPEVDLLGLLLNESAHEQVLRRSGKLLAALVRGGQIRPEHVSRLLTIIAEAHSSTADLQRNSLVSIFSAALSRMRYASNEGGPTAATQVAEARSLAQTVVTMLLQAVEEEDKYSEVVLLAAKMATAWREDIKEWMTAADAVAKRGASGTGVAIAANSPASSRSDAADSIIFHFLHEIALHRAAPSLPSVIGEDISDRLPPAQTDDSADADAEATGAGGGAGAGAGAGDGAGDGADGEADGQADGADAGSGSVGAGSSGSGNTGDRSSGSSRLGHQQSLADAVAAELLVDDEDSFRATCTALQTVMTQLVECAGLVSAANLSALLESCVAAVQEDQVDREATLTGVDLMQQIAGVGGLGLSPEEAEAAMAQVRPFGPAHDRVPRLLDMIKRILRAMHQHEWILQGLQADGEDSSSGAGGDAHIVMVDAVQHRGVTMAQIVVSTRQVLHLVGIVYHELLAYAQCTPAAMLHIPALSKRFNFLFTLLRYDLELSAKFSCSNIDALWRAVNQWPTAEQLQVVETAAASGGAEALAALAATAADAPLLSVVLPYARKAAAPSPALHASRECFWLWLRRVAVGGLFDLRQQDTLYDKQVVAMPDPEELVVSSARADYLTPGSAYGDPDRAGAVCPMVKPLLAQEQVDEVISWCGLLETGTAAHRDAVAAAAAAAAAATAVGGAQVLSPRRLGTGSTSSTPGRADGGAANTAASISRLAADAGALDRLRQNAEACCRPSSCLEYCGPQWFAAAQAMWFVLNDYAITDQKGMLCTPAGGKRSKCSVNLEGSYEARELEPGKLPLSGMAFLHELATRAPAVVSGRACDMLVHIYSVASLTQLYHLGVQAATSLSTTGGEAPGKPKALPADYPQPPHINDHPFTRVLVENINHFMDVAAARDVASSASPSPEVLKRQQLQLCRMLYLLQRYYDRMRVEYAGAVRVVLETRKGIKVTEDEARARFPPFLTLHRTRYGDTATDGELQAAAAAAAGLADADIAGGADASLHVPALAAAPSFTLTLKVRKFSHNSTIAYVLNTEQQLYTCLRPRDELYRTLFRLLDSCICDGSDIRQQTWQLLISLPTSERLELELRKPESVRWHELLASPAAAAPAAAAAAAAAPGAAKAGPWQALYALQIMAAQLSSPSATAAAKTRTAAADALAAAEEERHAWLRTVVEHGGLQAVVECFVQSAPPPALLASGSSSGRGSGGLERTKSRRRLLRDASSTSPAAAPESLTIPTTTDAAAEAVARWDPSLCRDITAAVAELMSVAHQYLRPKDLELCGRDGEQLLAVQPRPRVTPAQGLRRLVARTVQALWIFAGCAPHLMPTRKPTSKTEKVQSALPASTVKTATALLVMLRQLLDSPGLDVATAAAPAPTPGAAAKTNFNTALATELFSNPTLADQIGAIMHSQSDAVRQGVVNHLFKRLLSADADGRLLLPVLSTSAQQQLRRSAPTWQHSAEFCQLLQEIARREVALAGAGWQRVLASHVVSIAELISSWWASVHAARGGLGGAAEEVVDVSKAGALASSIPAPHLLGPAATDADSSASASSAQPLDTLSAARFLYLPVPASSSVIAAQRAAEAVRARPRGGSADSAGAAATPAATAAAAAGMSSSGDIDLSAAKPFLTHSLKLLASLLDLASVHDAAAQQSVAALSVTARVPAAVTAVCTGSSGGATSLSFAAPAPASFSPSAVSSASASSEDREDREGGSGSSRLTVAATLPVASLVLGMAAGLGLFGQLRAFQDLEVDRMGEGSTFLCVHADERAAAFTVVRSLIRLLRQRAVGGGSGAAGLPAPDTVALAVACLGMGESLELNATELSASTLFASADQDGHSLSKHDEWHYSPAHASKAASGFVGLNNMGNTCYINAVVQQLYMSPLVRRCILQADVQVPAAVMNKPSGDAAAATAAAACAPCGATDSKEGPSAASTEVAAPSSPGGGLHNSGGAGAGGGMTPAAAGTLLLELQRTFLWLRAGDVKAYDPRPFIDSCAPLGLPLPVYYQNDASEFVNKLLDAVEGPLHGNDSGKVLSRLFGGMQTTRKQRKCCSRVDTQQPTPQWFLSVGVQEKNSLLAALADTFKPELLAGSNAVECPDCKRRSATVLQPCLSSLPELLVIHLKRFSMDFDDGGARIVKLNHRVSFPQRLDMRPYTAWGQGAKDKGKKKGSAADAASGGAAAASYGAEAPDGGSDEFELVGCLIHNGTAQGGHYYSLIRDRGDVEAALDPATGAPLDIRRAGSGNWFRFDDQHVSQYDPSRLPHDAYGGTTRVAARSKQYPYEEVLLQQELTANALMLFYERRQVAKAQPGVDAIATASTEAVLRPPFPIAPAADSAAESSAEKSATTPAMAAADGTATAAAASAAAAAAPTVSTRAALVSCLKDIHAANRAAARHAFAFDPALRTFLAAVAEESLLSPAKVVDPAAVTDKQAMAAAKQVGEAYERQWRVAVPNAYAARYPGAMPPSAFAEQLNSGKFVRIAKRTQPLRIAVLLAQQLVRVVLRLRDSGDTPAAAADKASSGVGTAAQYVQSLRVCLHAHPPSARWFLRALCTPEPLPPQQQPQPQPGAAAAADSATATAPTAPTAPANIPHTRTLLARCLLYCSNPASRKLFRELLADLLSFVCSLDSAAVNSPFARQGRRDGAHAGPFDTAAAAAAEYSLYPVEYDMALWCMVEQLRGLEHETQAQAENVQQTLRLLEADVETTTSEADRAVLQHQILILRGRVDLALAELANVRDLRRRVAAMAGLASEGGPPGAASEVTLVLSILAQMIEGPKLPHEFSLERNWQHWDDIILLLERLQDSTCMQPALLSRWQPLLPRVSCIVNGFEEFAPLFPRPGVHLPNLVDEDGFVPPIAAMNGHLNLRLRAVTEAPWRDSWYGPAIRTEQSGLATLAVLTGIAGGCLRALMRSFDADLSDRIGARPRWAELQRVAWQLLSAAGEYSPTTLIQLSEVDYFAVWQSLLYLNDGDKMRAAYAKAVVQGHVRCNARRLYRGDVLAVGSAVQVPGEQDVLALELLTPAQYYRKHYNSLRPKLTAKAPFVLVHNAAVEAALDHRYGAGGHPRVHAALPPELLLATIPWHNLALAAVTSGAEEFDKRTAFFGFAITAAGSLGGSVARLSLLTNFLYSVSPALPQALHWDNKPRVLDFMCTQRTAEWVTLHCDRSRSALAQPLGSRSPLSSTLRAALRPAPPATAADVLLQNAITAMHGMGRALWGRTEESCLAAGPALQDLAWVWRDTLRALLVGSRSNSAKILTLRDSGAFTAPTSAQVRHEHHVDSALAENPSLVANAFIEQLDHYNEKWRLLPAAAGLYFLLYSRTKLLEDIRAAEVGGAMAALREKYEQVRAAGVDRPVGASVQRLRLPAALLPPPLQPLGPDSPLIAYEVVGAGVKQVNGVYRMLHRKPTDTLAYGTFRRRVGTLILHLQVYNMRGGGVRWFITAPLQYNAYLDDHDMYDAPAAPWPPAAKWAPWQPNAQACRGALAQYALKTGKPWVHLTGCEPAPTVRRCSGQNIPADPPVMAGVPTAKPATAPAVPGAGPAAAVPPIAVASSIAPATGTTAGTTAGAKPGARLPGLRDTATSVLRAGTAAPAPPVPRTSVSSAVQLGLVDPVHAHRSVGGEVLDDESTTSDGSEGVAEASVSSSADADADEEGDDELQRALQMSMALAEGDAGTEGVQEAAPPPPEAPAPAPPAPPAPAHAAPRGAGTRGGASRTTHKVDWASVTEGKVNASRAHTVPAIPRSAIEGLAGAVQPTVAPGVGGSRLNAALEALAQRDGGVGSGARVAGVPGYPLDDDDFYTEEVEEEEDEEDGGGSQHSGRAMGHQRYPHNEYDDDDEDDDTMPRYGPGAQQALLARITPAMRTERLQQLTEMGFEAEIADKALKRCAYNVEVAMQHLLDGDEGGDGYDA